MINNVLKIGLRSIFSLGLCMSIQAYALPLVPDEFNHHPGLYSFSADLIANNLDFDDNLLFKRPHYCTCPCINERYGTWIQFFAGHMQANTPDRANFEPVGYGTDARGIAIGVDRWWNCNFRGGFAYAFSQNNGHTFDSVEKGANVYSQQGLLFGRYQLCEWYCSATGGFALNRNVYDRYLSPDDISHFTGWQFNGKLELGYELQRVCRAITYHLVPLVRLNYRHLITHDYHDFTGVSFETDPLDYLNFGFGALLSFDNRLCYKKWRYTPYARLVLNHTVLNSGDDTHIFVAETDTSYTLHSHRPYDYGYALGLGVAIDFKNNNYLSFEYDCESKSRYHMYAGFIKYRYEWC